MAVIVFETVSDARVCCENWQEDDSVQQTGFKVSLLIKTVYDDGIN